MKKIFMQKLMVAVILTVAAVSPSWADYTITKSNGDPAVEGTDYAFSSNVYDVYIELLTNDLVLSGEIDIPVLTKIADCKFTLKDVTITTNHIQGALLLMNTPVNLVLEGTNRLVSTSSTGSAIRVYNSGKDVTFTGSGELYMTSHAYDYDNYHSCLFFMKMTSLGKEYTQTATAEDFTIKGSTEYNADMSTLADAAVASYQYEYENHDYHVCDIMIGDAVCNTVWMKGPEAAPDKDYLCLTANTADSKVTLTKKNTPDDVTLQYSTDGTNWYDYTIGTEVALVNANDKVYFRNAGTAETFSKDTGNYYYFVMDGSIAASGNVMSLIDNSCTATTIPSSYCFTFLFNNCTGLTSAPNLPAETLAESCYWAMFSGCTGLTTAPELPATTLAENCYSNMFSNCSGLTTAPALPATTLAEGCYSYMFSKCTILTTAPELPANTLAARCYYQMFYNCSGLTTAPTLPATTLAESCYYQMFYNCSGLTTAPTLPATTLAESCYYGMFQSCKALTTAPALPATTLAKGCYQAMFSSCISLTAAPALPVTTLAEKCYSGMFSNCSCLTTAPALPATTLAEGCYNNMFSKCTGLTTAPELPVTTLAASCYSQMFNGCTGLTTAPELPATTLAASCYSQMFNGCTSLTTAPELPATTLAASCYSQMFYNCSGLTTAPELPATTLAEKCYDQMFAFCTLLTTAPELPATNTAVGQCYNKMFYSCKKLESIKVGFNAWEKVKVQGVTSIWVSSVSSTGEFMCPADLPETRATSNIPSSWTVKNTYDLTVSGAWASMCVNLPLTVPEGAMVYYASAVEGSTITLTQIPANTVMAAKTAVIVKKPAEGTTVSFPIAIKDATITPCTDNLFQGSSVAKACNAGENYVLNASKSSDDNVHFSIYTGTTLSDHKAWLPMSAVGGASSIQFRFGDATAISTVEMESSDDVLYNLAGQRVSEDYRGIVIKNGKKTWNN